MGIELVAGRRFTDRDTSDAPGAVVVSESLARYFWPSEDPLGQQLIAQGAELGSEDSPVWQTVVGVVGDARYREIERARFNLYVPFTQVPMDAPNLVVRSATPPATLATSIRNEVRQQDAGLVVGDVATLASIVARVTRPWRFNMMIAGWFTLVALVLSALGLFGTVACTVADRTREIGLRRVLGAPTVAILQMVLHQAVVQTLLGGGLGFVLSLGVAGSIEPLLYGVAATDATAVLSVSALLLTVALSACFLAAYRAVRIDPMIALRTD